MKRLQRNFFDRDTITVAKELLGKYFIHKVEDKKLITKIVEVEAYKGIEDKACHSYGGRRTDRTEIMYGKPGIAYIYMIYGMYYCMNIVTEQINNPCAVLIRAVEPVEGIEMMSEFRYQKKYEDLNKRQKINLTNGPGKLCKALNITKNQNGWDLCKDTSTMYIADIQSNEKIKIKEGKRINIAYAQEAAEYPWRFYIEIN